MGETGDSGHGLGFGKIAKLRGLPPFWERFAGPDRGDLPDSRSGLIMGDFTGALLYPDFHAYSSLDQIS